MVDDQCSRKIFGSPVDRQVVCVVAQYLSLGEPLSDSSLMPQLSGAAPARAGYVLAYYSRWCAYHHASVWDITRDDRSGADHYVTTDTGSWQDDCSGADPGARPDDYAFVHWPLNAYGQFRVFVSMVLICDIDVRPGLDIVSDDHTGMRDNVASLAYHASISDPYDGIIGKNWLSRHHADRHGCPRSHHDLLTERDPFFVEYGSWRERQHAAFAEPCKSFGLRVAMLHHASQANSLPHRADSR